MSRLLVDERRRAHWTGCPHETSISGQQQIDRVMEFWQQYPTPKSQPVCVCAQTEEVRSPYVFIPAEFDEIFVCRPWSIIQPHDIFMTFDALSTLSLPT